VCVGVFFELSQTDFLQRRRGFDADLIVADEFAFIQEKVIVELIMPLMMQDKTAIVGLTTPKGEKKQFFLMLLNAKDRNDKPIFLTLRCQEYCDSCALAGKADTCPHEVYARSTNKTAKSMDAVSRAYGEEYQLQKQQEILGMDGDSKGTIIPQALIDMFLVNVVRLQRKPRCFYITVDPGGGGQNSEMGIVIAAEVVESFGTRLVVRIFLFFTNQNIIDCFFFFLPCPFLAAAFFFFAGFESTLVFFSAIVQTLGTSSGLGIRFCIHASWSVL